MLKHFVSSLILELSIPRCNGNFFNFLNNFLTDMTSHILWSSSSRQFGADLKDCPLAVTFENFGSICRSKGHLSQDFLWERMKHLIWDENDSISMYYIRARAWCFYSGRAWCIIFGLKLDLHGNKTQNYFQQFVFFLD